MSTLLMQAAQSAAHADGLNPQLSAAAVAMSAMPPPVAAAPPPPAAAAKKKGPPLRRGKWTPEEEAYANRLIQEFKAGLLPLTDGTTLRTFLSKLLNCDPMRISKKFVGSNCIGKQVFRRRTADLNRLTPEQIQQSRAELSELERRFLERVAQTNRVKSSGVGSAAAAAAAAPDMAASLASASAAAAAAAAKPKDPMMAAAAALGSNLAAAAAAGSMEPPMPPWLQPPLGYKHGAGAAFAQGGANSRAAAAGRALLGQQQSLQQQQQQHQHHHHHHHQQQQSQQQPNARLAVSHGSAQLLAEIQRQASHSSLLQNLGNSATNLLAAAAGSSAGLAQLAASTSANRLAGLADGSNTSVNNLMLQAGLSRNQLSHLNGGGGALASASSLSNMMQRQNSFDALMSLDFQSLQSIDNLANLIQSNAAAASNVPEAGLKNADFQFPSTNSMSAPPNKATTSTTTTSSSGDLTKRLASAGRMESLLRTLSANAVNGGANASSDSASASGIGSNANLSNLLQSVQQQQQRQQQQQQQQNQQQNQQQQMQQQQHQQQQQQQQQQMQQQQQPSATGSAASLFGTGGPSAVSLANLLRQDSSTGLSALRVQDGLNQRNSSIDDFLSLVAAGDIPHQDPSLLNVPLTMQQSASPASAQGNAQEAAKLLAKQQIIQAASSGNLALVSALASRSLGNLNHAAAVPSSNGSGGNLTGLTPQQQAALAAVTAGTKRKAETDLQQRVKREA